MTAPVTILSLSAAAAVAATDLMVIWRVATGTTVKATVTQVRQSLRQVEMQTADAGQLVFNLGFSFTTGVNAVTVFVNGLRMTEDLDWTETDSNTITFTESLIAADEVIFEAYL